MRINDKLQLRFEHLFITAAVATLNGVNRLWLNRSNAHNPALTANTICADKCDLRVVPELDSENPLSGKKGAVQLAALLDFVR
ncbi:MAG: hypothetical protein CAF43_004840 [Nitrospira sp. CG24C]|nr:MAG: hypothetical protein CAF43_004840 [Nitrospira sp. CG24C]